MIDETFVNGVNTDLLEHTIETVRSNTDLAKFTLRAKNRWDYGAHCCTTVWDFYGAGEEDHTRPKPFTMEADEPDVLLGTNTAPNPTEACLFALSSCVMTTMVYYAAAKGIELVHAEIEMEGELDLRGFLNISQDEPTGFKSIKAIARVTANASEDQIKELVELGQKHSPVFNTVVNPTPVHFEVEAHKAEVYEETPAASV